MTLFTGSGSLPTHQYVFVDSGFVRREREGFEPCVWFGLHGRPGRAWGCNIMLECGAVYRNLPPHALAFRPDPAPWTLEESQLWDCYGAQFSLHVYDYLAGLKCIARTSGGEVMSRYMFTAIPIGDGFSEAPDQAKEFFFLATEGGRMTIQPSDKVLWIDASYTDKTGWPRDLKVQTETYSAERGEGLSGPTYTPAAKPEPEPAPLRRRQNG